MFLHLKGKEFYTKDLHYDMRINKQNITKKFLIHYNAIPAPNFALDHPVPSGGVPKKDRVSKGSLIQLFIYNKEPL